MGASFPHRGRAQRLQGFSAVRSATCLAVACHPRAPTPGASRTFRSLAPSPGQRARRIAPAPSPDLRGTHRCSDRFRGQRSSRLDARQVIRADRPRLRSECPRTDFREHRSHQKLTAEAQGESLAHPEARISDLARRPRREARRSQVETLPEACSRSVYFTTVTTTTALLGLSTLPHPDRRRTPANEPPRRANAKHCDPSPHAPRSRRCRRDTQVARSQSAHADDPDFAQRAMERTCRSRAVSSAQTP
jgi:hypothetical protein